MTLSHIDKLKAEIAKLEGEALKELKAKREALVAEIASVDEQIAALVGTVVIGPSARRRAEKKPARSTSLQELRIPVANASENGHGLVQEDPDLRNDEVLAEDNSPSVNQEPSSDAFKASISMSMMPVFVPRIPVLGKSPHPIGFSYPLGASAMSEALAGLPMFDRFTLYYSNRTLIFTMPPPLKGFPILRITYTRYPVYESRGSTRRFQGGERWAIEVLPTPFDHRELIQKVILEKAVPLLREWLTGPDLPTSDVRRMAKACWYVVETGLVKWIDDETV
jgi:hypothetical protein